ncbi:carbon-nitrogen hydrolase family protein [Xylophilus ampelinus]|uniref:Nitrilase n=1 Tax=Xylophilus ampelinus TaxID=54067 RepID=A0A318SH34_9BURK|nr:carbon-nitrogen hydrolase family protein [Xylophilus ampelinus]MCS4510225.1 carbon-nitrogen hydrolase family protein [Xylophilus ampelinus]PYE78155.1 nitrilase [Xylophilus ampelinus]
MHIAALQMVSGTDLAANLRAARTLLEEAAGIGAELAVLPEYFCLLGQRDTDKLALQEPFGRGPIQDFLATAARELDLWIAGGTLPIATDDPAHAHNTLLVFGPDGHCAARYDKMHLFRFDDGQTAFDEARTLVPGGAPVTFELPSRDGHRWRIGLSVCYDLRFPELYRHYAAEGCDLLLVPSAFTHVTGEAHWELLLRARAVENLAYVCAAAQGGLHANGRRTWGHSMLVDAWGGVLAQQATGAGVVPAQLDATRLRQSRTRLPALGHRRL